MQVGIELCTKLQFVDIIHLSQDRGQWQVLVDTEMKL